MTQQKLKVIVVGAGFGGLTAAIECKRRGMDVTLIEKYINTEQYGDIIDFARNGGSIMAKWGDGSVGKQLIARGVNNSKFFQIHDAKGNLIFNDPFHHEKSWYWEQFHGHRGEFQGIVVDHAIKIGVNVIIGKSVTKYNDEVGYSSVNLDDGQELRGDVVIAADGPKSLALPQIFNTPINVNMSAGYGVYRAHYKVTDEMRSNPILKDFISLEEDKTKCWYGNGVDMFAYCWNKGNDIAWIVTHTDDYEIKDKWSFSATNEEVLGCMEEFCSECTEMVKLTPPGSINDYKLPWRETLKEWVSKNRHIIIMGDACHCHTLYSGQGGSQAVEDGYVIAECLGRTPNDIPLALEAAKRLRYNRSVAVHYSCITYREMMHNTEIQGAQENPEDYKFVADWVITHNVDDDIKKYYDSIIEDIKTQKPGTLEELSAPATGKFVSIFEKNKK